MDNEEIEQLLSKIDKKLDKLLNLNTKIAKFLHLVPVTEKEERELQILQRKNLAQAAKITQELDDMENKPADNSHDLGSIFSVLENAPTADVYDDVIGSDFLAK
jgi:hypothetical protein